MERLSANIAQNLSRIRKTRGLSLDKVAELTGVSKGMLSQIEKGVSNPTVSILWKIANGLQLSFTSLLEDRVQTVSIVSRDQMPILEGEEGAFRSRPLFPFDARTRTEVFWVEMDPGCIHESDAHNEGVEEYLMIEYGSLDIEIAGVLYSVEQGQSIRFVASLPHRYINTSDKVTGYHAVLTYSA